MSLRAQLTAAFAYVLVLVLVALLVPLVLSLSRRVDAEVRAEAVAQAQLVAATADARLASGEDLDRLVGRAAPALGGRVIVVDRSGRLLADSAGSGLRSASYRSRPEIMRALGGRTAQGIRRSDSLDADLLYTALPIARRGRTVGAVRVTQSVAAVQAQVRRNVLALVAVGAVALLLGLGVAVLMARSLARPLLALAATARRVAGGDLDARAELSGPAEVREVAKGFNEMTSRLGRALAAQREFVGNASHQLRTPLTGLRLRLEAAQLKTDEPEVRREMELAEREIERLAALLTGLLTLASDGTAGPGGRTVAVAQAAHSAHERWEGPAADAGHDLHVEGVGSPHAAASAADVAVMLDNLVENAIKYSPRETRVTVGWREEEGCVVLWVSDEGPGLSSEDAARAFDRFFRGRSGTSGSGLGLAIVETLARRHGGSARLVTAPGRGTRAEVVLPRSSARAGHDLAAIHA